jgi:UDP-N-acetyl-D-mannosaminuronic acid transferase (WecB/TagA/CpsF family)
LNLAFLGFLSSGRIKLNKYLLNWPDGIFKWRFFGFDIPKVSGLDIITNIKIPNMIENIYILGSLSKVSKEYLVKKFYNFKLIHVQLPYGSIQKIYQFCPKNFTNKDLIICTLPTPKQEQLSQLIAQDNKYFKIICIGGAVAMASGEEMVVPTILNKLNLEFLWRLRTDSKRRVMRLFYSFYFYIYGELTFKFKRIKTTVLD